jgi:hypothetical protein
MTPGHGHIIKTTAFLIEAKTSRIFCNISIGIICKTFMENNFIREPASERERISYHGPLLFPE